MPLYFCFVCDGIKQDTKRTQKGTKLLWTLDGGAQKGYKKDTKLLWVLDGGTQKGHKDRYFSEKISNEKKKDVPDLVFLKKLEDERGMACEERREIPFDNPKKIASIRQHYGELVRCYLRKVT